MFFTPGTQDQFISTWYNTYTYTQKNFQNREIVTTKILLNYYRRLPNRDGKEELSYLFRYPVDTIRLYI